jgi:hypothetical protein
MPWAKSRALGCMARTDLASKLATRGTRLSRNVSLATLLVFAPLKKAPA